jgi:phosphoribosylaminoimidazolecarboxamide formyltransferase/IMP cyclohydrolase
MAVNFVSKIDDRVKISNILVSVSDKSGLDKFIPGIIEVNPDVKIYSTGGTFSFLEKTLCAQATKHLVQVSDYTGQPEMQGGLVKTLDFKIYLGLLSETYNEEHTKDLARVEAIAFDMVVSNLYPFEATIRKAGVTPEEARANIDIGGPCMVRASAKNFLRVASVTDPSDYGSVLEELRRSKGYLSLETRYGLSAKAFAHTAAYDTAVSGYFAKNDFRTIAKGYTIKE